MQESYLIPSCLHSSARPWRRAGSPFKECLQCGLVLRAKMPTPQELDEIYREHFSAQNLEQNSTNMDTPQEVIARYVAYLNERVLPLRDPDFRLLDFGAGTGRLASGLKSAPGRSRLLMDCVEFSEDARSEALRKYGLSMFSKLPDSGPIYDGIVSFEVIEHLTQPELDLRNLFSVLKPGGFIYFSTPNRDGLLGRLHGETWREAAKPFHLILFNFESLRNLLERAGFTKIRQIHFPPLTQNHISRKIIQRGLQACGLYGGLHVMAEKPN